MIEGYSFVEEYPTDRIDLAFSEAIETNIFSVSVVSPELLRLWVHHRATDPLLPHGKVSLPNPFYMHCHNLETTGGQEVISSYLFPFFIVNHPHTDTFLVPYCDK